MLPWRRAWVAPMREEGRGWDRPTWAPGKVGLARPRAASVRDDSLRGAHSDALAGRPAPPPLPLIAPIDHGHPRPPARRGPLPVRRGASTVATPHGRTGHRR